MEQLLKCLDVTERELFTKPPYTTPLPGTGTTVGEILNEMISAFHSLPPGTIFQNNTLVQFLHHIDPYDLECLQRGVRVYSSSYRYYEHNSSLVRIPLVDSVFPTGGAIGQLAWRLSKMKHEGILNVSSRCQVSCRHSSLLFNLNFLVKCDRLNFPGNIGMLGTIHAM
jgi:hypothetical protein